MTQIQTIKDVREQMLRFSRNFVARQTGLSLERLDTIEAEGVDVASIYELEILAQLYGIDSDCLMEEPIDLLPGDGVAALASLDEFQDIGDTLKARVIAVANAARDLVYLRAYEAGIDTHAAFVSTARMTFPALDPSLPPYRQGAELANAVRRVCQLGQEPIPSFRTWVDEHFPWIEIVYASLGSSGPAGLCFADPLRGPTIALNLEGKNQNPCVRRFSLAHELCHLLVDWNQVEPLATLSGYLTESRLAQEQRANAFAVRLLCPEPVLAAFDAKEPIEMMRVLTNEYGLHYSAARLYLRNERNIDLPPVPPSDFGPTGIETTWALAERPHGIDDFPLLEVPPERRTHVAMMAARLYALDKMSRDEFARMLGLTPAHQVEQVLDLFGFDPPESAEFAA